MLVYIIYNIHYSFMHNISYSYYSHNHSIGQIWAYPTNSLATNKIGQPWLL